MCSSVKKSRLDFSKRIPLWLLWSDISPHGENELCNHSTPM